MMATVNLGRVGFVPKGEYSASTQYVKFDTVTYGSNTYVAWATVTGVTPGTDETKWKLLVNNNVDIEELKGTLTGIAGLDELYTFVDGKVDTNPSGGSAINPVPQSSTLTDVAVIPCQQGDVFTVYCDKTGSNTHYYAWAFITSDGAMTSEHSAAGVKAEHVVVTAPENAAYLIVQNTKSLLDDPYACKGISPAVIKKDQKNNFKFIRVLTSTDYIDNLTDVGFYVKPSDVVPADWPESINSSVAFFVLNFYRHNTSIAQILIPPYNSSVDIYYRGKSSSGWGNFTRIESNAVSYKSQSLSSSEKATARANIGAADAETTDSNTEYRRWENETIDNSDGEETISRYFDIYPGRHARKNMLIHIRSMWTGTNGPICYWYRALRAESSTYVNCTNIPLGRKNKLHDQTFRVPRWRDIQITDNIRTRFRVDVPAGTVVTIKWLYNDYDDNIVRADTGITLCAHAYSGGRYPVNTMTAFAGAARLGYKYCITIPKVTQDGVYVCLHDSTIGETARTDDGGAIDPAYDVDVSTLTYSQLLQFDFGIKYGVDYAGERIPLLDDFFKLCAVTGMHPMLSVHPSLDGHWDNIKAMADKYGLLDKLNIKGSDSYIAYPMSVLGNDIESYTYDYSSMTASTAISYFGARLRNYNIDSEKVRLIIENMGSTPYTQADVDAIKDAGYLVSRANYDKNSTELTDCIDMGVTWFTDDFTPFVGLNWL